jgi:hypothetical protein
MKMPGQVPATLPHVVQFGRYMNPRFAFAVDVPTFLAPGPPAGNGDGRVFTWGEEFELRVYGAHHWQDPPPTKPDAGHRAYPQITSAVTRDANAKRIVVTKLIYADKIDVSVMTTVTPKYEAYFAPIIERAHASLRITTGGMYDRPKRNSQPLR